MRNNNIGPRGTPGGADVSNLENDGGVIPERENSAQVFFRRVGRFFSRISDAITGAFLSFAQSARNAWTHVEQAFSGRDPNPAMTNIRKNRRPEWVDLDEEISGEEVFEKSSGNADQLDLPSNEGESVTPDFFGMNNPSVSLETDKDLASTDARTDFVDEKKDLREDLIADTSYSETQNISNGEKIFNEFFERFDSERGYSSITPEDPAFDASCLEFAKKFQLDHPENSRIQYKKDIQRKREAATALVFADFEIKNKAADKKRVKQEVANKLEEQKRRQALPLGQADFQDFSNAFQVAQKSGREYKFAEGSKFLEASCLAYAKQRLAQQPDEDELSAINALLSASHEPVVPTVDSNEVSFVQRAAAPPPSPAPRWKQALQNLLSGSTGTPEAHEGLWMVHHSPDDQGKAWEGLHLLLLPQKPHPTSATVSDNEGVLNYQIGAGLNDEYELSCFELARYLLDEMVKFNADPDLKNRFLIRKPDYQQEKLAADLKGIKSIADIVRAELQVRIDKLLPKKIKAAVENPPTGIPRLEELNERVLTSASQDFNQFVEDFSTFNLSGSYEFTSERLKYRRPACVAVAQSAIETYTKLDTLLDHDQKRLAAALFLINQYSLSRAS